MGSIGAAGAGTAHAAPLTDGGWTTSVTAPTTVAPGEVVTLEIDVTPAATSAALIDVEVYSLNANGRGWQQAVQEVWDAQTFAGGRVTTLELQWTVPDDEPTNVHWVKVGVFKPGWGVLYHWNDSATSFQVTDTPTPTTTTPPTTSAPTTTTKPPTTTAAPTTTVAPTTTKPPPTTAAPTTTVAPTTTKPSTTTAAPTTTVAPTTTTRPPTTTAAPPTTTKPSGNLQFSEDFSNPQAFYDRFDHQFDGNPEAGSAWGGDITEWPGDHDASCGDPNLTSRTIKVSRGNTEAAFYPCLPAGDPAKGHVMTSVNNEGYVIAWFSPKQTFANVRQVCWDQNIQDLGGGKWTQVLFLTQAEVARVNGELGFTSPEFSDPGGTGTDSGKAAHGVKIENGGMTSWSQIGEWNLYKSGTVQRPFGGDVGVSSDKAPRYKQCITDNENGTLTAVRSGPKGTLTSTVQGEIPNEPIRVVFEDDNYNPDKHNNGTTSGIPINSGDGYTWHWDNIQIS